MPSAYNRLRHSKRIWRMHMDFFFFFFQAEDGIRDWSVTGVQTCAFPISYAVFCLKTKKNTDEIQSLTNLRYRLLFLKKLAAPLSGHLVNVHSSESATQLCGGRCRAALV